MELTTVEMQACFIGLICQTQMRTDRGTKIHILTFCARLFHIRTAVILPHVHKNKDLGSSLWAPPDLSPARKTSIPAPTLICAQPHANRDSRHTKWKIELGSTSNATLWRPRRNPACRSNEPKISHQKADYCKLNLTVRPHQRWWIAESHLAGEQRNVTHCSLASCGTDPEASDLTQNSKPSLDVKDRARHISDATLTLPVHSTLNFPVMCLLWGQSNLNCCNVS